MLGFSKKKGQDAFEYGIASMRIGKVPQAEESFRKAIRENADAPQYWSSLGVVLQLQHKIEEAQDAWQRALNLDPNDASSLNGMGSLLYDRKRFSEAIVLLDRCVKREPKRRTAWVLLGQAYLAIEEDQINNAKRAINALKEAITLKPNCTASIYNIGSAYVRLKAWDSARSMVKMLTNLDLNAARELGDLIGLSEAENELAFVFCDPVTKDPAFREALRHFDSSDYIRALGKLRPLLGQYPPSAYYFCLLGISAARTGAHNDAIAAFQSAMRLDLTTVGNWVAGASLGSSELFSGGDGSAPQEAVVINVFSTAIGIPAEYAFLEREYGEQNKDWKVSERQVLEEGNRVIERFSIATKGGQTRSMFFDATSFYGKW